jgi:hypothetical protein
MVIIQIDLNLVSSMPKNADNISDTITIDMARKP